MRTLIKKAVPWKLRIYRSAAAIYLHDMRNFIKYSSTFNRYDTELKLKGFLTKAYHVVEKGLTMPEPRLGFGKENIARLIELCKLYSTKGFDKSALEFRHSIQILNEYLQYHAERSFEVDPILRNQIKTLSDEMGVSGASEQIFITKNTFFSKATSSFDEFCTTRRTVRHFTEEEVPLDLLHRCIELAQSTPTPCNRQPNRAYIIKDKELMKKVFSLQNGNRGFGHLGNAVIVFTTDLSVFQDTYERNEMFLNSGMFSMSFIYALHRFNIGSCALNWSVPIHKDVQLKKILNIPQNEKITLTLVCGYVPDQFRVASSPKWSWKEVSNDL